MRKQQVKAERSAVVYWLDNTNELVQLAREHGRPEHTGGAWGGGGRIESVVERRASPDHQVINKAKSIIDQIDAELPMLHTRELVEDVAGAYPIVPEAMAGYPLCMRRATYVQHTAAPLKLFTCVGVNGGVSNTQLVNRGIAILALAMKLSEMRPVELWVFDSNDAYKRVGGAQYHCVKVDCAPMDMATAVFLLCDPGVPRTLMFSAADENGFDGRWGWGADGGMYPGEPRYDKAERIALGATPDDLVIRGAMEDDRMLNNPVAWVRDKVLDYIKQLEGED